MSDWDWDFVEGWDFVEVCPLALWGPRARLAL